MSDDLLSDSRTNAAEYTVSEISGALRRAVEDQFGNVRVRGEISGYRGPHSSGHAYFALKDDRARLEAVVWRTTMAKLRFRPEEGMEVIASGKLTTYPGSSKYQIVIDNLEPAGAGALMALLEERKRKLAAEGLFDTARKRRLPYMPRVVGVITSPTGAVIRDIIHRIKDRFPVHVLVWPVRVQGDTCGAEVTAAVLGFNALPEGGAIPRPDLLIVARGGGSLEDLWGFNDEALARAVAASAITVIAAVGHETDWTLVDLVADMRAPTPTGAAEMAVPVKAELEAALAGLHARLQACATRGIDRKRQALRAAARALPSPDQLLALPRRRFDEATTRLGRALTVATERKRARFDSVRLTPVMLSRRIGEARRQGERDLARATTALRGILRDRGARVQRFVARLTPVMLTRRIAEARRHSERDLARAQAALRGVVRGRRAAYARSAARLTPDPLVRSRKGQAESLAALVRRGDQAATLRLERLRGRLSQADRLLATLKLSDTAILERGYALVTDASGNVVRRAAEVAAGMAMTIRFADGSVGAHADGETRERAAPKPHAKTAKEPPGQGSLF
jgi:exodeoxyribonuclease VII large subunit